MDSDDIIAELARTVGRISLEKDRVQAKDPQIGECLEVSRRDFRLRFIRLGARPF